MAYVLKLQKSRLENFISKYHLGGNVESVKWVSDGKKLTTNFINDTRILLGSVTMKDFTFGEDFEMGIFTTSKLTKLLSALDSEVTMKVNKINDEAKSIEFVGQGTTGRFNLSQLDVIPTVPKQKEIPKFDVGIKIDKAFIDRFISACAALSEVTTFYVSVTKDKATLTVGYASIPSNSIEISVNTEYSKPITNLTFTANLFKEVLSANKDAKSAKLEISERGLARIEFEVGDFKSIYYMVSVEEAK